MRCGRVYLYACVYVITMTRISDHAIEREGNTLIIRVIVPDGEPDSPPPLSEQATLTNGQIQN